MQNTNCLLEGRSKNSRRIVGGRRGGGEPQRGGGDGLDTARPALRPLGLRWPGGRAGTGERDARPREGGRGDARAPI